MISRAVTMNYVVGDSLLLRMLFLGKVQAGYPTSADGGVDCELDLNRHIFSSPETTMMVWMLGDGMYNGDPLIADSSLRPREGNLIIVRAGTEQLIKRVTRCGGALYLMDSTGPSEMI